jgi:NADH-quinone oxidoreductase subunit A
LRLAVYIPILIFLVVAALVPLLALGVGRLLRPFRPLQNKLAPYECGIEPTGDARERFSVRFYIIAILFVIFDVETIFLFPWAVIYGRLALFGFVEMLIFLGILIIGYFYAWKKGALEWV